MKSGKVCNKTRSPPAWLLFKGQGTEHTTVKWPITTKHFVASCCVICAAITSGTSGPRVLTFIRAAFSFPLFWLHRKEAISEAVSRCILLVFLEVKFSQVHFFPSASHFPVLFSSNSTFRFAILSRFNNAETFHFAFRHFCLLSRPSK